MLVSGPDAVSSLRARQVASGCSTGTMSRYSGLALVLVITCNLQLAITDGKKSHIGCLVMGSISYLEIKKFLNIGKDRD